MHFQTKRGPEKGFSLIELMVVMIVMMVVLGAVFTLMKSSINISNATFELTETRETLRIAHEYMNRDIITAGDGLNGINKIQVAQGFVTNYLARNMVADATRPGYVNLPIISSDADVPTTAVAGSNPAVNVLSATDRITILTADPGFSPAITIGVGSITGFGATILMSSANGGRLAVGEIYCFTSQSGAAFARITGINTVGANSTVSLAAAGSFGLNAPGATGPINIIGAGNGAGINTQSVSLSRVKMIHYYVNSRNELVKRVYGVAGAAGFTDNLVAEHIIGLSFRYILGTSNANGSVQQPVRQMTNSTQQIAVRQVEIKITGETTHATNFQRMTRAQDEMTTTASIRNLQFRQAQ